ncbi:MAG TPA: FkbM family methyltransferase [Bryobacteraceae bacterium]|nr:FkbM family methyltransferase [Bryobacteraceae bacterium]
MNRDLVFDIGLHNGDDAAYYLHLGYRVIGVDANPLLTAQCTHRFQSEILQGRITVINAGVLRAPGEFAFYRNLTDDTWSSFDPEKGKKAGAWKELTVPCVTTGQLIGQYGQPFFMKVDIEGADPQALDPLTSATTPAYVSLELNETDPILERLIELEYTAFKLVDGATHRSTTPIFDHQAGWRLLRKAGRMAPILRHAIASLPRPLRPKSEYDPPGVYSPDGYRFTAQSAGPFGELADGPWLSPAAALRRVKALRNDYRRAGETLWWDVHARHADAVREPPRLPARW